VKRALIAALWVGSLVATWRLIRDDAEPAKEAPVAAASERVRSAIAAPRARMPSITRDASDLRDRDPDDTLFRITLANLERDLADGRWNHADRDRLTAALPRVTGEQAEQLLVVLFPKLNAGAVKSEIDGPPI